MKIIFFLLALSACIFLYGCNKPAKQETKIDSLAINSTSKVVKPIGKTYEKDSTKPVFNFYLNDKLVSTIDDSTFYVDNTGLNTDSNRIIISTNNFISFKDLKKSDVLKVKFNDDFKLNADPSAIEIVLAKDEYPVLVNKVKSLTDLFNKNLLKGTMNKMTPDSRLVISMDVDTSSYFGLVLVTE
jgi:hypothetical protein